MEFIVAEQKNAPQIVALVNSAYRGDSSRIGWTTEADFLDGQRVDEHGISEVLAKPNSKILLAFDEERLQACVELTKLDDERVLLGMLTVSPELQNRGVGSRLLQHGEDVARDFFHAKKIILKVISIRSELIAYYERKGYVRQDEYEAFPYGDARFGLPKRDDLRFNLMQKTL